MHLRLAVIVAALIASIVTHFNSSAQPAPGPDDKDAGTMYFNLSGGRTLPYGIYGVRSIMPYWGARFGHRFGEATLEWQTYMAHAHGVTYYNGALSWAFPSDLEGWKFIPFLGLDVHHFSGHTTSGSLPFSTSLGFHLGVSPLFEFGKNFALRADFKFNYNPGKSLQVGGGFQLGF